MAYCANIRFQATNEAIDRCVRVNASSILIAALSAELICLGYTAGSGRKAEVLDIKNYARPPSHAIETQEDMLLLWKELNKC